MVLGSRSVLGSVVYFGNVDGSGKYGMCCGVGRWWGVVYKAPGTGTTANNLNDCVQKS